MASPTHPLSNKHIIIAGAGISGLAFAISLHKLWPSLISSSPPRMTLYERDPCAVPKDREGYSLSLRSDHPSAGIQTLQKMGLLDTFVEKSIAALGAGDGASHGGFCVWKVGNGKAGKEGERPWQRVMKVASKTPPSCPVSSLRIARSQLRKTLVEAVEALPDVKIVWDTSVTGVDSTTNDETTVTVTLSTEAKDTANILIAADGSSSKLRNLLRPSDTLTFAGPTCIFGRCPLKDIHPGSRSDEFGCVVSGAGSALFLAPVDSENMLWSLSKVVTNPAPPSLPPISSATSTTTQEDENENNRNKHLDTLLTQAQNQGIPAYGARFTRLLANTDKQSLKRFDAWDKPAFAHSKGYIESPSHAYLENRIVFIGDANHAVSPFAGNGANLALMDGWDLAETFVGASSSGAADGDGDGDGNGKGKGKGREGGWVQEALKRYDGLAVGRANKVVSRSHFSIRVMHSTGWWLRFWFVVLGWVQWFLFEKVE